MSEDKTREAILAFADCLEVGITKLRQDLGAPTTRREEHVDLNKIVWTDQPSERHPGTTYKQATEKGNTENEEYKKLKVVLEVHNGKITLQTQLGPMFVWLFPDKSAIGMAPSRYSKEAKK